MNYVSLASEFPFPAKNQLPTSSYLAIGREDEVNCSETVTSAITTDSEPASAVKSQRQQPIPPPSSSRQYRAIGLVRGRYQFQEQLMRGAITTADGTAIEAVLLGRIISLVKNHLNLEQEHLWVVYPRTRQEDELLHVQIVGVWEPETLASDTECLPTIEVREGYFSIRGEVIYASREQEKIIVKIRQSPKRESEKPKFFKLKLKGVLPDNPIGRFWDLQAQLESQTLVVQEATDLGLLPRRKKPFRKTIQKKPSNRFSRPAPPRPSHPNRGARGQGGASSEQGSKGAREQGSRGAGEK